MSRVSPFLNHQQRPPLRCRKATAFRSVAQKPDSCHESAPFALRVARLINSARLLALSDLATAFRSVAHVVIPTDYYDMSALRILHKPLSGLKEFSARRQKGLVSRVSPFFASRVARLINSARLLALSDLATAFRSVAHVVIPTDYYDMSFENFFTSR